VGNCLTALNAKTKIRRGEFKGNDYQAKADCFVLPLFSMGNLILKEKILQGLDEQQADNILVVGTSLKTSGSVDLIKRLSTNVQQNKHGQVYYMDLKNPPNSLVNVFNCIVQTDCQGFAESMLPRLDNTHSISLTSFKGKGNLKDWVNAGRIRNDFQPSWAWV
jgi:hypothetical protein